MKRSWIGAGGFPIAIIGSVALGMFLARVIFKEEPQQAPLLIGQTSREGVKLPDSNVGIVLSTRSADPRVQNGDAYDQAILDAADIKTLVVPDGAKVDRNGPEGQIEIYVKKSLRSFGHPRESVSIQSERKYMGCAYQSKDVMVVIATFGEGGNFEGGRSMALLFRVPRELHVEHQKGLSGNESEANQDRARDSVAPGWNAIPMEPDAKLTAK